VDTFKNVIETIKKCCLSGGVDDYKVLLEVGDGFKMRFDIRDEVRSLQIDLDVIEKFKDSERVNWLELQSIIQVFIL